MSYPSIRAGRSYRESFGEQSILSEKGMKRWLLPASACLPTMVFAQAEVQELKTRPDVTARFVYSRAQNPVAGADSWPCAGAMNPARRMDCS